MQFSVEVVLELDYKGWIVGSSIHSRENWMQWLPNFPSLTEVQLQVIERERCAKAAIAWDGIDRTTPEYLEIIKKWPIKK